MPASEIHSLNPRRDDGRRNFVCVAAAGGFDAAVLLVGARGIRTRSIALGEVMIPVVA